MTTKPNSLGITDIFEIRLDVKLWKKIIRLAEYYQISFSWIVRLCLIEVLENQALSSSNWIKASNDVKQEYKNPLMKLHRHMLCLYGQDGLLLRLVSARGKMTISHLVRVAIELQIDKLEKRKKISKEDLVKNGIKSNKELTITTKQTSDRFFHIKNLKFIPFVKVDYWRFRPCGYSRLIHCFAGG